MKRLRGRLLEVRPDDCPANGLYEYFKAQYRTYHSDRVRSDGAGNSFICDQAEPQAGM